MIKISDRLVSHPLIHNQKRTILLRSLEDLILFSCRSSWFPWMFSNPGWTLDSSHWARDNVAISEFEPHLFICTKKDHDIFIYWKRDSLCFSRWKMPCVYFTIFRSGLVSMVNVKPTSWNRWLSRSNVQEKLWKQCWFILTILQHTLPWS